MSRSTLRVAAAIRRYCAANPHARDTVEGIAWWLVMQNATESRAEIGAAVQLLVERGVLQRFQLNDGTEVFGCTGE